MRVVGGFFVCWWLIGCSSVQTPTSESVKSHRHQGLVESSRWDHPVINQQKSELRHNLSGLTSEAYLDKALRQNLLQHYDQNKEPWIVKQVPTEKRSSRVFSLGPEDEEGDTGIYLNPVQ